MIAIDENKNKRNLLVIMGQLKKGDDNNDNVIEIK